MKCDLLECSTVLVPGFEHQLRLELVEQLELELPCQVLPKASVSKFEDKQINNFINIFIYLSPMLGFVSHTGCFV